MKKELIVGKDAHKRKNNISLMYSTLLLAIVSFLSLTSSLAHGRAEIETPHATVSLFSDKTNVQPGQTFWLGLHFKLKPHWHVYWRNPGASGTAPTVRWSLPEGWVAGATRWPVPQRIQVGPLTNYGYEGKVTFLVPVLVPSKSTSVGPNTIVADAEWLVCREECIPESGRLSLEVNNPKILRASDSSTRTLFDATRARWPQSETVAGRYRVDGDSIVIFVKPIGPAPDNPIDVWFAANQWGPVDASGTQRWHRDAAGFALGVPVGDMPPAGEAPLEGLLVIESETDGTTVRNGYRVSLTAGPQGVENESSGLGMALIFALLGGLILNVMPCVLPVLGIKVLSFVKEAHADRRRLAFHGLLYSAGVLASLLLLAACLLILRSGGESLGWGFQLQSPILVTLLTYLMLLVGLNLSGVFSIGGGFMGAGQSLAGVGGPSGTFATGVLAAVVASPCTAPFMGAALGFAITRPAWEALAIFFALGAGFALPVLVLSLFPAWLTFIPKPGHWMKRFQQVLAFPMFATAAWLLWVLSQQADSRTYGAALAGLLLVAMGAWLYGQWHPRGWRLGLLGAVLTLTLALVIGSMAAPGPTAQLRSPLGDRPWSEQQVREFTAAGNPVFVNFTAAWCITCKVNEQIALSTENTRRLFASHSVIYLVADWTRHDAAISRELERYGRSGVPLYLLYSPGAAHPMILPQLLSEGIVADAIRNL